jgi:hypothetical protein
MIARINNKPERALREAITSVLRSEVELIPPSLAALDDEDRTEALTLASIFICYIVVDACGNLWPSKANARRIAEDLATTGAHAERVHLDPELIYAYLWRTVLGPERLEDVVPDEPTFTWLPVHVLAQALAVYSPKEMDIWDYLDRIESAIEVASALDASVLPAAVMRAYLVTINKGDA